MEMDLGNPKGMDGACFHCGCSGHVATKCIANMPQEVKDHIVSGTAHVIREDESDESENDDMTKIVTFARTNNVCIYLAAIMRIMVVSLTFHIICVLNSNII